MISPEFLRDLELVARPQLSALSKTLTDVRQFCSAEVAKKVQDLPSVHPLRSPVTAFGMIDYGRLETAYTRALAWLLSPNERHGFGDAIAREVLKKWIPDLNHIVLSITRTISEYYLPLGGNRFGRIDLWIEAKTTDGKRQLPILVVVETKIDSPQKPEQLRAYTQAIGNLQGFDKRVLIHLVLDSERSLPKGWIRASFKTLAAAIWRGASSKPEAPGYHFCRLFVAGILADLLETPLPIERHISRPVLVYSYLKQEGSQ